MLHFLPSKRWALLLALAGLAGVVSMAGAVERRTANNGQVVLEDVPAIPAQIGEALRRYQNVRSAGVLDWTADGKGLYVATRFAEVNQIHRVDQPGGARQQLTWFDEPVGQVSRQPDAERLVFTRDSGGSEFAQIYVLDPATGELRLLSDGESRNGNLVWSEDGQRLAFTSTRRDGRGNDIWVMDPNDPASARLAVQAPDGGLWAASAFDRQGGKLLIQHYLSITDSRVHVLDLGSGALTPALPEPEAASADIAAGFSHDADGNATGIYLLTDRFGEFNQLAWQALKSGATPRPITGDIPWSISEFALSRDGRRGAFLSNEDGISRLYLFDPASQRHQRVDSLPVGVVGGLRFSPDADRLAFTVNNARTPSDAYVLALGAGPLDGGPLTRWTYSEVGGLDTERFVQPELIHYPTFDQVDGAAREIPAFVYRPAGSGPHPVIIIIHGGPEGQARPTFSSNTQLWLAELGAAVIVPNVRGSSGYGKSYVALDNGYRREDSVRDIGALLDWIATQPELDAERVALFGGSYGGYMVLAGAVHYSDRLKTAVDIVGISNFVTFLQNTQDYRRDLRRVEYGDERDPEMRAFLQRISPLNNVGKIRIPLLVAQGNNDPRVPVSEAEQIVAALREHQVPVWYFNALNEGHGFRKKENQDLFSEVVMLFLRETL
jgi:dipeptidyl aminopeptidase/acylaminoacyl peptidase